MKNHPCTCKYCGTAFTIRCKPEDFQYYMKTCCKACWDNDEPGMARFDRMSSMMGDRWAIEHA